MSFDPEDTIVALATPPGRGAIGVVRLSGAEALSIAAALTARIAPLEPRRATLARLAPRAGWDGRREGTIDQVLVTWFPAPRSYTGQDIVEISGHGSPAVLRALIDGAAALGARPAGPGEFTLRAYLNGRLDLAQAEAVADLVEAVTPLQARAACDQLHGTLSTAIEELDTAIREVVARTGASLDFPDEIYVNGFSTSLPAEVQMELVRSLPGLEGALMLRPGRSDANIGVMAYDLRHRAAWSRTGCSPLAPSTGYCCASTMRT